MTDRDTPQDEVVGELSVDYCTSTFTIFQQGQNIWSTSIDFAGVELVLTLTSYLRYKYDLLIGKLTAEYALKKIGSALPLQPEKIMVFKGRNLVTGMPGSIEITSTQIREQIMLHIKQLVSALNYLLVVRFIPKNDSQQSQVPENLREAVRNSHITITGEYSWLHGLAAYVHQELGITTLQND